MKIHFKKHTKNHQENKKISNNDKNKLHKEGLFFIIQKRNKNENDSDIEFRKDNDMGFEKNNDVDYGKGKVNCEEKHTNAPWNKTDLDTHYR